MPTVGKFDTREVTIGRIRNTLELKILEMSENLAGQIRANPMLEILDGPRAIDFDGQGNLPALRQEVELGEPAASHR
jgi:hypothetical protein